MDSGNAATKVSTCKGPLCYIAKITTMVFYRFLSLLRYHAGLSERQQDLVNIFQFLWVPENYQSFLFFHSAFLC